MNVATGTVRREMGTEKGVIKNFFQIAKMLRKLNILDRTPRKIWKQLLLLNRATSFVEDEIRSIELIEKIAENGEFSAYDIKVMRIATLLSDIGKAGSARMSAPARRLITRMYGVENVPNGHKLSVDDFLAVNGPYQRHYDLSVEELRRDRDLFSSEYAIWCAFPEAEVKVNSGWEIGDDGQQPITGAGVALEKIPMTTFWSRGHVRWLQGSITEGDFGEEVYLTACLHHLLEGVMLSATCLGMDSREYTVREALVAVVDKYDAFRVRSGMNHEKTIGILRAAIEQKLPQFFKGEELSILSTAYYKAIDMIEIEFNQ